MSRPKIWIFVVDSRNSKDLCDLDHLDAILWGSNPNARKGDIILMYRTAPYKDLAYIFAASSDSRLSIKEDKADMEYVIELGDKIRLTRPISLDDLKRNRRLSKWAFARSPQGIMRRKKDVREEGFWHALRSLVIKKNPSLMSALANLEETRDPVTGPPFRSSKPVIAANKQVQRQLRVFISYTIADLHRVRRLYRRLRRERSVNLWFDKESLLPSDDWEGEIARAIRSSDIVMICLSTKSLRGRGFAKKEITWALQKTDEQPENTTSILPVKLEKCKVPNRLSRAQYAELFHPGGYSNLVAGLRKRAILLNETGTK